MRTRRKLWTPKQWTVVWFDGIDFWGKTSLATKLIELLTKEHIAATLVKCSSKNLSDQDKQRYEAHATRIKSNELKNEEKRAYMLHYLYTIELPQLQQVKELKAQWQIVLLDRSIISFVINRARDLGMDQQQLEWFRRYLRAQEGMLRPDIYIHVTADESIIQMRANTSRQGTTTKVDQQTLADIPWTLKIYQSFYRGKLRDCLLDKPVFEVDTTHILHMQQSSLDEELLPLVEFLKKRLSAS